MVHFTCAKQITSKQASSSKAFSKQVSSKQVSSKQNILPAFLGSILQYYDYALYGFGAHHIANAFFPIDKPVIALLKTFSVFLFGFIAKPLGAIFFGRLGDKYGRVTVLKMSMMGIALPTTCIGILPDYTYIGATAAVLLILCRFLQGFFVIGESDGARLLLMETFKDKPAFMNSLSWMSSMLGIGLAVLIWDSMTFLLTVFEFFESYRSIMWRIPFIIGGFFGFYSVWIRKNWVEQPEFNFSFVTEATVTDATLTVTDTTLTETDTTVTVTDTSVTETTVTSSYAYIKQFYKEILITILICGATGGCYHFYLVFWEPYLVKTLGFQLHSNFLKSQGVILFCVFLPIAGVIADRYSSAKVFKYSIAILLTIIIPLNAWMVIKQTIFPWVFYVSVIVLSFFSVPGFVILSQQFPLRTRFRGLSLGHALGSLLMSGSAPFVSLWIWQKTQIGFAPLFYFAFIIVLVFVALCVMRTIPSQ